DRGMSKAAAARQFNTNRRNLAAGLPWVRALEQAIGAARAVIVLIGPRGLGNTPQYELDPALIRPTREPAFPVVPVILPQTTTDLPFDFLRVLIWIDFSHVTREWPMLKPRMRGLWQPRGSLLRSRFTYCQTATLA